MSGIQVKGGPDMKKAAGLIENAVSQSGDDVAQEAYNEVRKRLNSVLRHPTGHYESRVMTSNQSDSVMISDGGVVYGPWLEGTSSRNGQTRFKGYHTFRQVLQSMDKKAEQIAEDSIAEAVKKL
jgi:hypothetical protein